MRNTAPLLISLLLPFASVAAPSDEGATRIFGQAQRWESKCEQDLNSEWKCEGAARLIETKEVSLELIVPTRPGDAVQVHDEIFAGITLRFFTAWPHGDAPILQSRIDIRGAATCATTEYLSTTKFSPLICAVRVNDRLLGVTLHTLRIR